MNTISYFEIQSSNPKREIEFYQNIFNWSFKRETNIPIEYYRIETKGMNGGLLVRPGKIPPEEFGTNAFTCSIQIENFDETSSIILSCGGRIAIPKFAVPSLCWQGFFLDQDNNIFGIFEVDPKAI